MRSYVRWFLILSTYVWVAQFVVFAHAQRPGNHTPRASLEKMVDGTAHRPFVYRRLVPDLARAVESSIPVSVQARIEQAMAAREDPFFAKTPARDEERPTLYLAVYAMALASMLGLLFTLRAALRYLYSRESILSDLLPIGIVLGLPIFFRYGSYEYDLPQFFLFTLGAILMMRERWRWFYPVLFLALLSKETSLLLGVIFVLSSWGRPIRSWIYHLLAMVGMTVAVRLTILRIHADAPGGVLERHLDRNLEMMTSAEGLQWLFLKVHWIGGHALMTPTNYHLAFLAFLPFVLWRWSEKPRFLRRSTWVLVPMMGSMVFFAFVDELRSLAEVYPLLMLLLAHGVFLGVGETIRPDPTSLGSKDRLEESSDSGAVGGPVEGGA